MGTQLKRRLSLMVKCTLVKPYMGKSTDLDRKSGQMGHATKETGKTMWQVGLVNLCIRMELCMTESGLMINVTVKASTSMPVVLSTREPGLKTSRKVTALKNSKMGHHTKVISKMGKRMERVNSFYQMERTTRAPSSMT